MAIGAGSIQRAAGKSASAKSTTAKSTVAKKAEPVKATAPAKKAPVKAQAPKKAMNTPVDAKMVKPVRKAVYIGEELPIYLL